jgi:hypothetical protein
VRFDGASREVDAPAARNRRLRRPSRHIHDDGLGWVPRPRHVEPGLTVDGGSLRTSGRISGNAAAQLPPILAVGDSFTFGEALNDRDTWPAGLQRLTGRSVLNGGVSGYGFDQIVLRAERLAPICRPGVIVAGFIADDIMRTEMRRLWGRDKPWFALDDGRLVARGVPVPNDPARGGGARLWRAYERVVRRLDPHLQHWLGYHVRVHPAGAGEAIAAALTGRLATLQSAAGVRVILLALYDAFAWRGAPGGGEQRRMARRVLDAAARQGLVVIDSFDALAAEPDPAALYATWHMNARGNLAIARLLAARLQG